MIEPAEVHDVQTMSVGGYVLVTDDSTARMLSLLGCSAIKLWNTALVYQNGMGCHWKNTLHTHLCGYGRNTKFSSINLFSDEAYI